jgi:UDP-glucose 4-epimerase
MKEVLVTGGLGYIGSHTVVELIKANYKVVIVDNLANTMIEVLDRIEKIAGNRPAYYQLDVNDTEDLKEVFSKHEIEAVIHFAAYKAVGESVEYPIKYYKNNVGGLISLLEVMKEYKVNNLVFSSSCTVYGQPDMSPVKEDAVVKEPTSPYGNTKKICEEILSSLDGINTISLRYFNPIGAHESAEIGELPIGQPNNLVPFMTQSASGWRGPLTIFGDDYNTPDGTCIRDYIHVTDLADAHIMSMNLLENEVDLGFEVINIGTGMGYSVLEVVSTFNELSDKKVTFAIGERRSGDVEQVWANADKAFRRLGWKPKFGLKEMLLSSWNWQKKLNSNKMST